MMFDTTMNKNWLQDESVVGLGRPLWTAKRQDGDIEELQEFCSAKTHVQH
jgi:hypothetical protein